MAIRFASHDPMKLLEEFNNAIKSKEITTWKKTKNEYGNVVYTHIGQQYKEGAFMVPLISESELIFSFKLNFEKDIDDYRRVYSYYHQHLSGTFINHFFDLTSIVTITTKSSVDDSIIF